MQATGRWRRTFCVPSLIHFQLLFFSLFHCTFFLYFFFLFFFIRRDCKNDLGTFGYYYGYHCAIFLWFSDSFILLFYVFNFVFIPSLQSSVHVFFLSVFWYYSALCLCCAWLLFLCAFSTIFHLC